MRYLLVSSLMMYSGSLRLFFLIQGRFRFQSELVLPVSEHFRGKKSTQK